MPNDAMLFVPAGNYVHALEPAKGKELWNFRAAGSSVSAAVADGLVFASCRGVGKPLPLGYTIGYVASRRVSAWLPSVGRCVHQPSVDRLP